MFYRFAFITVIHRLFFFVLQMLNSFASDLDSILSDLSTSPPLRGSQDLAGLAGSDHGDAGGSSHAASCPNLSGIASEQPAALPAPVGEDAVDSQENITLLERLIRSHPIWYLPNVQRIAAAQLLQDQEQGVSLLLSKFGF